MKISSLIVVALVFRLSLVASYGQEYYYGDFHSDITDPSSQWDVAVIKSLGVSSIFDKSTNERFQFNSAGKLMFYKSDPISDYYGSQQVVTYYPNGNLKCVRNYSSYCDYTYYLLQGSPPESKAPPAICFDLLSGLTLLDTAKAEKAGYVGGYDPANMRMFWMQPLVVEGHKIYVYYQVNTAGEIFYLKWSTQKDMGSAKMNQSLLHSKISFDSSGVISEYLRFDQVGSEWFEQADTVDYFAFQNVNGIPRCTQRMYWRGGEYEPLEKVYQCFDTDGNPGIDTCYCVLPPKLPGLDRSVFCFSPGEIGSLDTSIYIKSQHLSDTCFYKKALLLSDVEKCQPYAQSFHYTENGKILIRSYRAHYSYQQLTVQTDKNYRIDSMSISTCRILMDKFYKHVIIENFYEKENHMIDCSQSPPYFDQCFYYFLTHNKKAPYLDESWIYDPGVRMDSTHYVHREEPLSKRAYRKKLQKEITLTQEQLNDTARYEVIYYPQVK